MRMNIFCPEYFRDGVFHIGVTNINECKTPCYKISPVVSVSGCVCMCGAPYVIRVVALWSQ